MKVKEKKLEDGFVQLNATATAAEVDRAFDTAEAGFARRLGLRPDPNKTAAQAIAEKLSISDVDSVIRPQALDTLVPFALDARNIIPESLPQPESSEQLTRGKPYSFRVKVKLKPVFELSSYDPVEITVPPFEFDESLVDKRINGMLHVYPEFKAVDPHPVQAGDSCFIKLEASVDGKRVDNLCTDGRTLSLGQGFMPEDFERQVVGMEVGETKSFEFEGPNWDDFGETNSTYSCTVTVLEIQEETYPELTDEWVKRTMPMYDGIDALRKEVRSSTMAEMRHQYDLQVESVAQAELAERFQGSISNEAYELTARNIDQTFRTQIAQTGENFDEFVKQQGGEQNYNIGLMMQARQTLRADYALDALFSARGRPAICREQIPRGARQDNGPQGRGQGQERIATGSSRASAMSEAPPPMPRAGGGAFRIPVECRLRLVICRYPQGVYYQRCKGNGADVDGGPLWPARMRAPEQCAAVLAITSTSHEAASCRLTCRSASTGPSASSTASKA